MHEFTLLDADGAAHTYRVVPHPGSDGWAVTTELYGLCSGPLGGVLLALFMGGKGLGDVSVDMAALGETMQAALASAPKLTDKILRHTFRDDKALSDRSQFDAAYQRNYWELALAVWEVVLANRFLPPLLMSAIAKRKGLAGAAAAP